MLGRLTGVVAASGFVVVVMVVVVLVAVDFISVRSTTFVSWLSMIFFLFSFLVVAFNHRVAETIYMGIVLP